MLDTLPAVSSSVLAIALRDGREQLRDRFLFWATLALIAAATVSLVTGAIALNGDAATYVAARAQPLPPCFLAQVSRKPRPRPPIPMAMACPTYPSRFCTAIR